MDKAFRVIKKRFPEMKTITTDNDLLFKQHQRLELLLQVKIYFCHPYISWEKGTIERTNKEIWKYIPKGGDISFYSKAFIKKVADNLNNRWMRVLQHASPARTISEASGKKKAPGWRYSEMTGWVGCSD